VSGVDLTSSIKQARSDTVLVANSSDLSVLERLLKKFPTTEMESRMVKDSEWKDTLFIIREESDEKLITFPKNMESFADNLFMISLVRLAVLMGWKIQLSSKDLDTKVFETGEAAFFAGFIAGACLRETGPKVNGTTKFSKGVLAFQTYSVEKKKGKLPHLRTGGMDRLMERLSVMKGFTKDWWSLRGSIAAILKMIPPTEVSDLKTFMLPKAEIMKTIRTKLPFENGGLFRTEEIAYLSDRYSSVSEKVNEFLARLESPDEELATNFSTIYSPIKSLVERTDKEIRLLAVNRSKVLFPQGKKKSIVKFKAKTLEEKLEDVLEKHENLFLPESLPGITRDGDSNKAIGSAAWKKAVYVKPPNQSAVEIIDSWYASFSTEVDEEE
jgi:hypothetical protein